MEPVYTKLRCKGNKNMLNHQMFLGKCSKVGKKPSPEGIPLGQNGQIDDCSGLPPML